MLPAMLLALLNGRSSSVSLSYLECFDLFDARLPILPARPLCWYFSSARRSASLCACHAFAWGLISSSDISASEGPLSYKKVLSSPGVMIADVGAVDNGRPRFSYSVLVRVLDLLEFPDCSLRSIWVVEQLGPGSALLWFARRAGWSESFGLLRVFCTMVA